MDGNRNSLPNQLVSTFSLTPGDSSTVWEAAIVCATWFERHSMPAGKVGTTPSIHSTWSPRVTFHRPGPGTTPVTLIACKVTIDEVDAGRACATVAVLATGGVCAAAGSAASTDTPAASNPACNHRARWTVLENAPRYGRMQSPRSMGAPQAKRRDLSLTMNGGDGSGAVRSAAGCMSLCG